MGWIGLYRPDASEVRSVAAELGIHDLAVEDTITAHQRPRLERYGDVLFTVLRPARYIEVDERVEFGELHVFTGADFGRASGAGTTASEPAGSRKTLTRTSP